EDRRRGEASPRRRAPRRARDHRVQPRDARSPRERADHTREPGGRARAGDLCERGALHRPGRRSGVRGGGDRGSVTLAEDDDVTEKGDGNGVDVARIEKAVREILLAIGEDPDRDGLVRTPDRVGNMYAEIF